MKGIIFDFNGTMFLDSHLHEAAWLHMIHDHTKDGLSDEDILKKYSWSDEYGDFETFHFRAFDRL